MAYAERSSIDLTPRILAICTPLVKHPEDLHVTRVSDDRKSQSYLVTCHADDVGKLLGRDGMISDALRTIVNIALRPARKKASIKFEANPESR